MTTLPEWFEIKMILIPIISALIGWMTNWVAVKMLFHPKKPVNLVLFTLQGVFHRRQRDIAFKLAEVIESRLFSSDDIKKILESQDFHDSIFPVIETCLDDFIKNRLTSIHPMLVMLPESMIQLFKEKLMEEFENFLPKIFERAGNNIESHLRIKETIKEKIESFDVNQLEEILFSIMKSEFKTIEYIGGVIGFFIGITQLIVIKFF